MQESNIEMYENIFMQHIYYKLNLVFDYIKL